jgi:hypothetical protein
MNYIGASQKKIRVSPKGNKVVNWGFQTISHKAFNGLAQLFINKKKIITKDLIKNHLTSFSPPPPGGGGESPSTSGGGEEGWLIASQIPGYLSV